MGRWFKRHRAAVVVAAAVLVAAAFIALLWKGAAWLDAPRLRPLAPVARESAIDAIRGRLLQLGAGLVIAGGLVYTGLTFRLSREGQVTDRYTKAIEQIGSDSLDVRLGAIYALERIMVDSERDHPTIVEVLAAYVREHAPLPDEAASGDEARSSSADLTAGPATDVQAALAVLGRRPRGRTERDQLDLRRTMLCRADLWGAMLKDARLEDSDLKQANFGHADLTGADLAHADLTRADLNGTALERAKLTGAHLAHAHLIGADLTGTNLIGADLTGANLEYAKLTGAHLDGADLTGTKLNRVDLTGATMTDAMFPPGFEVDAHRLILARIRPNRHPPSS